MQKTAIGKNANIETHKIDSIVERYQMVRKIAPAAFIHMDSQGQDLPPREKKEK